MGLSGTPSGWSRGIPSRGTDRLSKGKKQKITGTPKQALETGSAASCGVLNPPLRGIVQLTNSATLRFRNWSFNNKNGFHLYCKDEDIYLKNKRRFYNG
jgi:hypothetical protein